MMKIDATTGQLGSGSASYALAVGAADALRLQLLNDHYNPASRALLLSAGLRPGDHVADVGCGHGVMTAWIADNVGPAGIVYALDASAEQLRSASIYLAGFSNVRPVCAPVEARSLPARELDVVYSRFLMLHLSNPAAAVAAMADMLKPGGCLVVEVEDIGALRFVPGGPDSELWRNWWFALARARGASHDVARHFDAILRDADLSVERMDVYQPISTQREAKLLHALGFQQLTSDYIRIAGADPADIQRHADFLTRVIDDPRARIELYRTTHYVARKPR